MSEEVEKENKEENPEENEEENNEENNEENPEENEEENNEENNEENPEENEEENANGNNEENKDENNDEKEEENKDENKKEDIKKEEKNEQKEKNAREEFVFLSKLYERAERFSDMVSSINKFIEMNPKLTKDEKNIVSAGYKNILTDKRTSWRLLNCMEKKETKKKSAQVPHIKEIKSHIQSEMKKQIEDVKNVIDKYLLPNAPDPESKVFYLRLKADHIRYLCEITKDKEYAKAIEEAEKVYREAYDIANKELPVINNARIGLCLNFSVFCYEVKGDKKEGCKIAKKAFEDSMKYLDDLEKFKSKDVLLLIQLLKENLIFWSSEMSEEEQN